MKPGGSPTAGTSTGPRPIGRGFVRRADAAAAERRSAGRSPRPSTPPLRPADPLRPVEPPAPTAGGPGAFGSLAAVLAAVAVASAPWLSGRWGAWQVAAVAGASALAAAIAAVLSLRSSGGRTPALLVPLAGLAALGLTQAVAPIGGEDLETTAGTLAGHWAPVTVCRPSTRQAAALLAAGTLVCFLAARAGGTAAGRRVIWWGVAGTAAAFAVVGLLGRLGQAADWGLVGALEGDAGLTGAFFAGFNRSHAAQLLNAGLAASLALLLGGGGRPAAACGAVVAAGLIVTGSRAGLAAAPLALLATAAALALLPRLGSGNSEQVDRSGLKHAATLCVAGAGVAAAGVALALWGLSAEETGLGRLDETRDSSLSEELRARREHWADAVGVAGDLPLFGAGLGTHRYATPPYRTHASPGWYTHADNQYVELLVEGGAIGVALLIAAAGCLAWGVRRAGRAGATDAVAAATFAAAALGVQAGFDYGITRPATLFAAAALFGAAAGAGRTGEVPTSSRPRFLTAALAAGLALAGGWGAWEMHRAAPAMEYREPGLVDDDAAGWTQAAVAAEVRRLSDAVAARPDDAEARVALARLLMRQYRDAAAAALAEDPAAAELSEADVARLTDPTFGASLVVGDADGMRIAVLRDDPRVREFLRPAFAQLREARQVCPFIPRLDYHLARIAWAAPGEDPTGRPYLAALHRNFPADVPAQIAAARQADRLGLSGLADECWATALMKSPERAAEIAEELAQADERAARQPALAAALAANGTPPGVGWRFRSLLPDDPRVRLEAASAIESFDPTLAAEIAQATLDAAANAGSPLPPSLRARALRSVDRPGDAIAAMRDHLAARPRDFVSRERLIDWLLTDRRLDEAAEQLTILTALAPGSSAGRSLSTRLERARRAAEAK